MVWLFLGAALCLVIAAALAAVDAALLNVSHNAIEEAKEEGRPGALRVERIIADLPTNINVVIFVRLFLEAMATVLIVLAYASVHAVGPLMVILSVLTSSIAVFIVAGVSPRTIGRRRSLAVCLNLGWFVSVLLVVLKPLTRVLVWLGNLLTPDRVYKDGPFVTSDQLRDLVERASESDVIEDGEREMIQSVFTLSETSAKQVMVPRTDLVTVISGTPLNKVMNLFLRSGFSRIPISGEDLDDIEGVAYLKDVARRLHVHPEDAERPVDILARPVLFVPETKPADELLAQMQVDSTHLAILVDEYGGTAGLVTIEDIVEEIVGEIEDEYDTADDELVAADDGSFIVNTRMSITDFADHFDVRIDVDDVNSVGGLLTTLIGRVPIAGSTAEIGRLRITALEGQGRRHRITHVSVTKEED
ncbi:CBS domain containing-hemolysin-like protein [Brevibacterium sanguinis]|uniref:CBS domain containing-hemolysin-like protein n=2 Tax=Brevibacterium TaxID=1696 RepID=A0A366IIC4_9MICO|nr:MULTISPECIES: hemolysin family protein [Brevibacterium]RBP63929.1 CBS domain containing-hemolysin-like protein [Brevibacterium sanguinis]RBP70796.1 CBS domain containing-hemolysin-like protein [Brevibacterium celere]